MAFPRINLPLIIAGSALINNLLLLLAVLVVFALLGHVPGKQVAWIPLLILFYDGVSGSGSGFCSVYSMYSFAMSARSSRSCCNSDCWFTPIVYTPDVVPQKNVRTLLQLNPMTTIVQGFHNAMLFDRPPEFPALALGFGLGAAVDDGRWARLVPSRQWRNGRRPVSASALAVSGLGKAFRSYRSEWQRVLSWPWARR